MAVEALILSDILSLKTQENTPPSFVLWSVLVGVLISRGDWDTAVDILIKMENTDIIANNESKNNIDINAKNNNNNNYNNNYNKNNNVNSNNQNNNYKYDNIKNKKFKKFAYKAVEVSQTLELAIFYSLEGGLPLLTKTSSKALFAMDLQRLLPKNEITTNQNEEKESNHEFNNYILNNNKDHINNNYNDKNIINKKSTSTSTSTQNLNGILYNLNRMPIELSLRGSDNRTVSTMGDILGFLERCKGDNSIDDILKSNNNNNENGKEKDSRKKKIINYDNNQNSNDYDFDYEYDYNYSKFINDNDSYNDDIDINILQKNKKVKNLGPRSRVPVGVTLLQSLFADAINERKFKQAARIIRLLEGSRLVIDMDTAALVATIGNDIAHDVGTVNKNAIINSVNINNNNDDNDNNNNNNNNNNNSNSNNNNNNNNKSNNNIYNDDNVYSNSNTNTNTNTNSNNINNNVSHNSQSSTVKIVRETLARRWAALLIASSLNKLKNNVAGSVKLIAALKHLQSEKVKEIAQGSGDVDNDNNSNNINKNNNNNISIDIDNKEIELKEI